MKRSIKWLLGLYVLLVYPVWSATETSKPTSTSDDFNGYTTDAANISQSNAHDSVVSTGRMGWSSPFYYYNVMRFPSIDIAQAATVDSAFLISKAACSGCTDSAVIRVGIYNADNGIQVTDTAAVRTTWAARATIMDTAWIPTTTSWSLNVYHRLPFDNLHGVIQQVINRAGWTSGNAMTLITVGVSGQGGTNRATRTYDSGPSDADSLLIYYTVSGGGGGGGTPNTILRSATIRTTTIRAPEKMFYRRETWKW